MSNLIADFIPLTPEIFTGVIACFALILGLYKSFSKAIWWISGSLMLVVLIYLLSNNGIVTQGDIFGGYSNDNLAIWLKSVLLSFTLLLLIFYGGMTRVKIWVHGHHEFVVLILLAAIGGMVAISARNFLILFVAIELVSIISYIIVAYERDNPLSVEAGMKYFILGSLASCIMIFGMSYIYGFSGSLSFASIKLILSKHLYSAGLIAGIFIFLAGLFFKMSLAPFHFWIPDIYQGAPFVSTAFLASIPKFIAVIVLINIVNFVIIDIKEFWEHGFILISILSMVIGAFGAIKQSSIKRLMGYSAVLNMGFVLLAIATASTKGFVAAIIYQIIYSLSSIGLFANLAITIFPDAEDYPISNLIGFGIVKKLAAFSMSIFMFSMAAIPPLAGFFGKFYVLSSSINNGFYVASIIALLVSVIAAYYYINIVRLMYFSQPIGKTQRLHESSALVFVISISIAIILLFPFIPHVI